MDKVYIATLTQTSTNAPVATELVNSLGALVWTRSSAGVYIGTLASAFSPLASSSILIPTMTDVVSAVVTDINSVTITCSGDAKLTAREVSIIVSTHYCTFTDLERKISRTTLAQLTSDTANPTIGSAVVVESILANVDATINALAGQVYTVPFTTIPDIIKRIEIDLACYEVMQRRPVNMDMPKEWQTARDAAMKQLEAISNMLLYLPDTATVASAESAINTDNAIGQVSFTDSNNPMSDY
jgi:phage gp36-like protein